MIDFEFYNPARIIYGKDSLESLEFHVKELGSRILFHYGQASLKKSGLYDEVIEILNKSGVTFFELGGVKANPEIDLVNEGIALCKKENIDGILAVGGGSVIDSAKGIAAGVLFDGDIEDRIASLR